MKTMRRLSITAISLGLALSAGTASAQDVTTAKALFEKGVADLQAGNFGAACPAIGESYRLDPRPGTLFTLAECFAKAGKTASAVARYEDYLSAFARMTPAEQAKQHGRDQVASEQRDKLKPHVPLLTLRLADGAPTETALVRDGETLGKAVLGLALPLDPGPHTIVAQAPGGPPASQTVTLAPDEKKELTLTVKLAEPGTPPPPLVGGPQPTPAGPSAPVAPPPLDTARGSGQRTAGFVVGGVGVAGLVIGAVTGGLTLAKKSAITGNCNLTTKVCNNATGKDAATSAQTTGLVSTIGFVAGGVALAGGVVIIATAPKGGAPKDGALAPSLTAAWSVTPGGGSLGLRGAF
jgi:hypothetical protein